MRCVVSIIIPNYNKGDLVLHSLDCLLRQTYGEWEALVIDDCSTDVSWTLVRGYAEKDSRIKVFRNETNRGGNYSRNRGAAMAQGKYLIFLDSDDWLADDCLENRVHEFELTENADVDLLVFNMATVKDGKARDSWKYGNRRIPLISFLRHEIVWSIMMPIWRRAAFDRIGGFDEAFPRLQDVELHTRALLQGAMWKFAKRETPDCFYYVGESRMTTNHAKAAKNFGKACLMYVEKMHNLISNSDRGKCDKARLRNALQETLMAAICGIGLLYQRGLISEEQRMSIYHDLLDEKGHASLFVKAYAFLFKFRINKVRGFNFFYRRLFRFFQTVVGVKGAL